MKSKYMKKARSAGGKFNDYVTLKGESSITGGTFDRYVRMYDTATISGGKFCDSVDASSATCTITGGDFTEFNEKGGGFDGTITGGDFPGGVALKDGTLSFAQDVDWSKSGAPRLLQERGLRQPDRDAGVTFNAGDEQLTGNVTFAGRLHHRRRRLQRRDR